MSLPFDYVGKIQNEIFDLETWPIDDKFANYPVGARPKMAFFPPSQELSDINRRRRYLLKGSDKRYPDQFWAEIVAYHIGCLLDVVVPPAFIAHYAPYNFCGACIEWFYTDGESNYVAAGDFLLKIIPDYNRKTGEQHNVADIYRVCKILHRVNLVEDDWRIRWAETFVYDALIGNTDRHQDNWGIVIQDGVGRLTPLFDNGTSLGNERFPEKALTWSKSQLDAYILKGKHHVKSNLQNDNRANHLDLIRELITDNPALRGGLCAKVAGFSAEALSCILSKLKTVEAPIPLTQQRIDLILKLTSRRQHFLLDILT